MCAKFQFDLMKISETTAIQTFAFFFGLSCTMDNCIKLARRFLNALSFLKFQEIAAQLTTALVAMILTMITSLRFNRRAFIRHSSQAMNQLHTTAQRQPPTTTRSRQRWWTTTLLTSPHRSSSTYRSRVLGTSEPSPSNVSRAILQGRSTPRLATSPSSARLLPENITCGLPLSKRKVSNPTAVIWRKTGGAVLWRNHFERTLSLEYSCQNWQLQTSTNNFRRATRGAILWRYHFTLWLWTEGHGSI